MNTKIEISEAIFKNGWCNVKTSDNQEISINIEANPETCKKLNEGTILPITLEVNLVEKNGKKYGWDFKADQPKKSNPFIQTPEQIAAKQAGYDKTQRQIIAQSSLSASVQF